MKQANNTAFIALCLLAILLPLGLPHSSLDYLLIDQQFLKLRADSTLSDDIAIVGVDDETYKQFPQPEAMWHPQLGAFLTAMAQAEPRALVFDVVLPQQSYDFLVKEYDKPLLRGLMAFRKTAPLILAQTIQADGELRPVFPPVISLAGKDAMALPLVELASDRRVRSLDMQVAGDQASLPTLAGRMAEKLSLPKQDGLINYGIGQPFDYIPLQDVLALAEQGDLNALKQRFANRVVMLGPILHYEDRHDVPVPLAAWEPDSTRTPGVLIQAQAIRTLMQGAVINEAPTWVGVALALLLAQLWWLARRPAVALMAWALGSVALYMATTALLSSLQWLPIANAIGIGLLAVFIRFALTAIHAAREKARLNQAFGRYVSPGVMKQIVAGELKADQGGTRQRVCVLFSDIRSFTTRSETQPPEAIVDLLNQYFEEMTASVHDHHGTIDKFIGDGLMAFFGAPEPLDNPARAAVAAAEDMLKRLKTLNKKLIAEGIEEVKIGVGLHIGDVVVGHIGSSSRHEYTVIGDTVNLAARLESLSKNVKHALVISDAVYADLDNQSDFNDLGFQAVKGRADARSYGRFPTGG